MKTKLTLLAALLVYVCIACNSNADTTTAATIKGDSTNTKDKESRNKQTAMEALNAVSEGSSDAVFKEAAPDIVDYGDGSSPSVTGVDSVKKYLGEWMSAIKFDKPDNMKAVADGDEVFVYSTLKGKFTKDFMGMKTSGKSFTISDVDMFTFNDAGKMTSHRSIQPMSAIMNQVLPKSK